MFHGPLLHLGTCLFTRQLALEHLGAHGLALGAELLDEGLLLRRRVGAEPGVFAGSEAGAVASGEAGAGTSADTGAFAGGKALAGASTEALAGTSGEAATLTNEATALAHPHAASTLSGKVAHLLLMLDTQRLTTGEVVDSRECPGLQATLRKSRYCNRGQRHGETKELDGAHLRLPMSVGDWTAPLHNGRCGTRDVSAPPQTGGPQRATMAVATASVGMPALRTAPRTSLAADASTTKTTI